MSDVKTYRITGKMLLSHDKFPEWRKFTVEVRALKPEDAVQKVYSDLGSRHKLKRYHIKIENVEEVELDETSSTYVVQLSSLEGWERA